MFRWHKINSELEHIFQNYVSLCLRSIPTIIFLGNTDYVWVTILTKLVYTHPSRTPINYFPLSLWPSCPSVLNCSSLQTLNIFGKFMLHAFIFLELFSPDFLTCINLPFFPCTGFLLPLEHVGLSFAACWSGLREGRQGSSAPGEAGEAA